MKRVCALFAGLVLVACLAPASALDPPVPGDAGDDSPVAAIRWLLSEVDRLTDESKQLRKKLADARLEAVENRREAAELQQFIRDHEELGRDFEQYHGVKEVAEREARQRQIAANRERIAAERAKRRARLEAVREERDRETAEEQRLARYRRAGFAAIGLNVFTSRMAYSYETYETNPVRIDYDPWIGLYYRPGGSTVEINYRTMTISGSVVNAEETVRNIGIAVRFFDAGGNQVGAEIVQINNARPDVPYPFTATIDMALDRAFSSANSHVLFADPAGSE